MHQLRHAQQDVVRRSGDVAAQLDELGVGLGARARADQLRVQVAGVVEDAQSTSGGGLALAVSTTEVQVTSRLVCGTCTSKATTCVPQ